MLVLSRRPGESLVVGDSIEVRVIRIDGDRVVIGVVAPSDIRVMRSELLEAGAPGPATPPTTAEGSELV